MSNKTLAFLKINQSSPICHKISSVSTILAMLALYLWDIVGKINETYPKLELTSGIMDAMGDALVVGISVINTLSANILNRKQQLSINASVKKIDIQTNRSKLLHVSVHCVVCLTFSWDIFSRNRSLGWAAYKYNLVPLFFLYKFQLFALQIHNLATKIERRFNILHREMAQTCDVDQITNCMKTHYVLSKLMENISTIYGWQILLMYKMLALYIVGGLYFIHLLKSSGLNFHVAEAICYLLWNKFLIVGCVVLVFSCDRANQEAEKTPQLCRNLKKTKIMKQFLKQVDHLAPTIRLPQGSPVDRRAFFDIISDIINYVVIVLQFDG
ncbi:gustatory receptor 94 [Tribolium castaneum]|uniref:Gustatory receptor n=1 Tax=Tribolium castaneum TaxID=7070 RepID=D2A275_TRICA|nr:gustatory receptor 94 [Tribolium castaneum]